MEHLSTFQITNEELDISRRVIKGELNLEAAMDQLQEMFWRMPGAVARQGDRPADSPSKQMCLLFLLACSHTHKHARPVNLPDVIVTDCLLHVWTSFVALSLNI
jgi:hypothetical protein